MVETKITLSVPDHVYQQAERIAQAEQRPVAEILNEALAAVFPSFHVNPQWGQMLQEQAAFQRQHAQLLAEYEGSFVAMCQGRVVDADLDQMALVARIDERYPEAVVLIKRVTREPERVLHMRSPRWVRD